MGKDNNRKKQKVTKEESLEIGMLFKSEFTDEQLERYFNKGTIHPSEKPEMPPQVLWVGDCTIATFGNFSASTGKAKSKKTFNVSAMVAAAIKNGTVLNYKATMPEGKRKIFYFDTEQSRYHCHKVLGRILKLSGQPIDIDSDMITFVGLREYTPSLRLSLIDYALRKSSGYGLVIIDGLRDLMYDINNAKEATDVITMLMAWTSLYNLHIHCVLHLNKNDNNTRGHIGTELENKERCGWKGEQRARFIKLSFPSELKDVEVETIRRNLRQKGTCKIEIDVPENGSFAFHYPTTMNCLARTE